MRNITLALCAFVLVLTSVNAQFGPLKFDTLTNDAQISIITVGPGEQLNDAFGHSGIRIKNKKQDLVFNYGVYDFNTPNFYLKFTQGKLNYLMGVNLFRDFKFAYIHQNRSITEQVLNLNFEEKQRFYNYITNNYKPKNRAYLYDFFFDNCATKLRDISSEVFSNKINFKTPENFKPKTFRTLIQENLNRNFWGSFGIDLALGSKIDLTALEYDHMFLPKNIQKFFAAAEVNNKPFVLKTNTIYSSKPVKPQGYNIFNPYLIFSLIALLILFITYNDFKKQHLSKNLDSIIFFVTGLIGVILLLLWFATDHSMTTHNYNLLWAFPLNLLFIKSVRKTKLTLRFSKYILFLILALCLMTIHWISGVQEFSPALLPILVALIGRYLYLLYHYKLNTRS